MLHKIIEKETPWLCVFIDCALQKAEFSRVLKLNFKKSVLSNKVFVYFLIEVHFGGKFFEIHI